MTGNTTVPGAPAWVFLGLLACVLVAACERSEDGGNPAGPAKAGDVIAGLGVQYDTLAGVASLSWKPVGEAGYDIFRREGDPATASFRLIGTSSTPAFADTLFPASHRDTLSREVAYRVSLRGTIGQTAPGAGLELRAGSPSLVRTVAALAFSAGGDTLSPGDTLELRAAFRNPTRGLRVLGWHLDGIPVPGSRMILTDLPMAAETAVRIGLEGPGVHVLSAVAEDAAGAPWRESVTVHVIPDAPRAYAGRDTIVRAGSMVNLAGVGTDRFGEIRTWEWRCGEAGAFTPSPGGSFTFRVPEAELQGYACILRVTDDDGMAGLDTVMLMTRYRLPGDSLAWEIVGGDGSRGSWDGGSPVFEEIRVLHVWRNRLYAGLLADSEAMRGQVWSFDGMRWVLVGGKGVGGSWADGTVMSANALASDARYLYAGTGIHLGMARVWRFDGTRWEQIGGDGLNGGWGDELDCVWHLTVHRGELYAGLVGEDIGARRAPLYRFDGRSWHLVADESDDGNGWNRDAGYFMNYISVSDGNSLYVGLAGREPGSGDVFSLDPAGRLRQIGGDGLHGSWSNPQVQFVEDAIVRGSDLLVALNGTKSGGGRDVPVWRYDGKAWSPVGDVPEAWEGEDAWIYNKLYEFQGELYLGVGGRATATSMWKLDAGGRWAKVGGHGLHGSGWNLGTGLDHTLWVYTITAFAGDLYIGLASAEKEGMAQVWRYGPKR